MAEGLAELCPAVVWKAEIVKNELGHIAGEIPKKSGESEAWFLLAAFSKI